jgi:protein dithiol:quinone oxidoreductase
VLTYLVDRPRVANLLGALACAALLGYALYAQYGLGLAPCPLCIFQRVGVLLLGLVFLLAALHPAGASGRRAWAVLVLLAAAVAAGVAGRHLWLQSLPPERVPACGPGLDFMLQAFPFTEVLDTVLRGSGECAKVDWQLLGLAMPAWVLLAVLALGTAGVAINLAAAARQGRRRI